MYAFKDIKVCFLADSESLSVMGPIEGVYYLVVPDQETEAESQTNSIALTILLIMKTASNWAQRLTMSTC